MDKILSARIDESIASRITALAQRLKTSKKRVIEDAIRAYAARVEQGEKAGVFEQTCGAWRRKESADQIVDAARKAFRRSMGRRRR